MPYSDIFGAGVITLQQGIFGDGVIDQDPHKKVGLPTEVVPRDPT